MRSKGSLGQRHIGLVLMLATVFIKLHGVQTATHLCVVFPCNSFERSFKSTDQLGTSEDDVDKWGYRSQIGETEHRDWPIRSFGDVEERIKEYEAIPALLERLRSIQDDGKLNRPLMMLFVVPPKCDPNTDKCADNSLDERNGPFPEDGRLMDKRSRMPSQRWSAAGLPFSVLYHKQVRARGGNSGNGEKAQEPQSVSPAPQRANEGWTNHGAASRRQYSTLPHLFVSYGWGPLGK